MSLECSLEPYRRGREARRAALVEARGVLAAALVAKLVAAVPAWAREFGIVQVTLFGSGARGELRPDSDIDLLVSGLGPERYFEAAGALSRVLGRDVDLVPVDQAPALLLEQVQRDGMVIDV